MSHQKHKHDLKMNIPSNGQFPNIAYIYIYIYSTFYINRI